MRLIESNVTRRRARGGTLLSVVLHAAAIGAVVVASADAEIARDDTPRETTVFLPPAPPEPAAVPSARTAPASGATTTRAPIAAIVAPPVPSIELPPIGEATTVRDPSAGLAGSFTAGIAPAGSGTPWGTTTGEVLDADRVERAAVPLSAIRPRYPDALRSAGIEGRVALRFVVDTAGRVEAASVHLVAATHPAFGAAARATVGALRFRPAEVGGHAVRQLVELPFEFRLRP